MKLAFLCLQCLALLRHTIGFQTLAGLNTVTTKKTFGLSSQATDTAATTEDLFDTYQAGSPLAWKDTKIGTGDPVEEGDVLTVAYTGYLWRNGKEFGANKALTFKLGGGNVMPGFDAGVRGIREGGKRRIRVPPALAYQDKGAGNGKIPPNSDLEFDVEVTSVARGPIAGTLALVGQNRLILFVILLGLSIITPMLGIGERGFI
jgi:FKBP-type peptidyl-prolyl cis-trans isomerase